MTVEPQPQPVSRRRPRRPGRFPLPVRRDRAGSRHGRDRGVQRGGRPDDAGPHPNSAKAAEGKHLRRLEPDPETAPVVHRIFAEYVAGRGLLAIAEGLTRDGIPSPSANDPARNRHRSGIAWAKAAVRAILSNPRYTGRQVWNKQRKDEQLLDVDDVALGHETKLRWNDPGQWLWSHELTHEALVSTETFERAQAPLGDSKRWSQRKPRTTSREYVLRGLLYCGCCDRRMQGNWNNGKPHYRCRFPGEYARTNRVEHPRTVYVREDAIVPALDEWLSGVFDSERLTGTIQALQESQQDEDQVRRDEAARRTVEDCDERLAKYRTALETGADPAVVSRWIAEVEAQRAAAQAQLREAAQRQPMTTANIHNLVNELGDLTTVIRDADAADKARVYQRLGLQLTYDPTKRIVAAQATVRPAHVYRTCPRGDSTRTHMPVVLRETLSLAGAGRR